jgi:DNA-binding transcriptional LysR family regulator
MLHHIQDRSGIRLFEQVKGRLHPTHEAQALFAEIQLAWKNVERVQRLCKELATGRVGMLRVAASPSLGTHVIPAVIKRLEHDFPELAVSLELFTPALLVDCLVSGAADVGVASYNVGHPGVLAQAVGATPIVCVMPRDHPFTRRKVITLSDLADQPIVTHSFEMPEGSLISEAFRSAGVTPRSKLQVRSGQSACWFVRSGAGMALLDATTVAGGAFPDLVARPVEPILFLPIVILRSPLRSLSKAAFAFKGGIELYCRTEFPIQE